MKVYISGPISGIADGNKIAFASRAQVLHNMGFEPVNPWAIYPENHVGSCIGREVEHTTAHRYGCLLRADIEVLMYCQAFTMLPGWVDSVGASTERRVATALGLPEIIL